MMKKNLDGKVKVLLLILCCVLVASETAACSQGRRKPLHKAGVTAASGTDQAASAGAEMSADAAASAGGMQGSASAAGTSQADPLISALAGASFQEDARDEYPYDIASDRKKMKDNKVDITVGDDLYMTQINDWFTNFKDYEGKKVEIEGYYIKFDRYTFVGRNGPTCPYCTGGYVDFEFKSDQDLSALTSGKSWISVTGVLRQGYSYDSTGKKSSAFYYIETLDVTKMAKVGVSTIYD